MLTLNEILVILGAHYVADFRLQSHWMATNKSKDGLALGCHVLVYTLIFSLFGFLLLGPVGIVWAAINGVIHFGVDYFTSRANSKLWAAQKWHRFFEAVGEDQVYHYICLFGTYLLFS